VSFVVFIFWWVLLFSIVVVAENPLYTTTTSRLWGRLCFVVCVWFGLLAGCGCFL
jgi:hypothetical protein